MTAPTRTDSIIGVNLCWLVPGVVGGSEEYTVRLLAAVGPALGPGLSLRLYGRPDLVRAHPELADRHTFVPAPIWPGRRAARVAVENSWLAWHSRSDDVIHHAGGTVPFIAASPRRRRTLVTIHDLQPLEHPENFGAVKRRWLGRALPLAAGRADRILCPSGHAADRVAALLGVPGDKLRVVPHGLLLGAGAGGDAGPRQGAEAPPATADELPPGVVPGRFLLYPAIAYPHKRHVDLLRVLDLLGPDRGDVAVVFTGRAGPEDRAVAAEARRLGLASRVHQLGRVPWPQLERLYRSAAALVFPSAYEGFGNPAVEAMSLGCPVVSSSAGALAEVVGPAGLVVPVGDVRAMADAVSVVLDDPAAAEVLRCRGLRRAGDFAAEKAAGRLADVYREMVDRTAP